MTDITNAMTVDVEDYFQVSAFANAINPGEWERWESRVERNTRRILEIFAEHDIKATFFVLGWVAERYPHLVREIADLGHEVACHGYSHQLVYRQEPKVFREETLRAKRILEDIVQRPVRGYRAASYSITRGSEWALDILAEAGFDYDSSIFPVRHDRYGMPDAPRFPYRINTPAGHELTEFPLSTVNLMGYRLPVSGGGYFRLFPYPVTQMALASLNRNSQSFIFYLHPWEIDPGQPRVQASAFSRFRHYNNLGRCEARLLALLRDFRFTTVESVLQRQGLLEHEAVAKVVAQAV